MIVLYIILVLNIFQTNSVNLQVRNKIHAILNPSMNDRIRIISSVISVLYCVIWIADISRAFILILLLFKFTEYNRNDPSVDTNSHVPSRTFTDWTGGWDYSNLVLHICVLMHNVSFLNEETKNCTVQSNSSFISFVVSYNNWYLVRVCVIFLYRLHISESAQCIVYTYIIYIENCTTNWDIFVIIVLRTFIPDETCNTETRLDVKLKYFSDNHIFHWCFQRFRIACFIHCNYLMTLSEASLCKNMSIATICIFLKSF